MLDERHAWGQAPSISITANRQRSVRQRTQGRWVRVNRLADIDGIRAHLNRQCNLSNHVTRVGADHAATQYLAVAMAILDLDAVGLGLVLSKTRAAHVGVDVGHAGYDVCVECGADQRRNFRRALARVGQSGLRPHGLRRGRRSLACCASGAWAGRNASQTRHNVTKATPKDCMHTVLNLDRHTVQRFCESNSIRRLALFGSQAKGTAGPDSDVDLLVDFELDGVPGLLGMAAMEDELSKLLGGRKVDLRTARDLSRHFRQEVMDTAQVQYAR